MLACATSSQGFGPLTCRLWGIRRVRTEEGEGERGTSQSSALQGSTRLLVLPHWESHSAELNDHARMSGGGRSGAAERTLLRRRKLESQVLVWGIKDKITKIWQSNRYILHVFWPSVSFTNHATLPSTLCLIVLWSIEGDNSLFTSTTVGQYGSPYLPSMGDCFILSLNGIRHCHPVHI